MLLWFWEVFLWEDVIGVIVCVGDIVWVECSLVLFFDDFVYVGGYFVVIVVIWMEIGFCVGDWFV